MDIERIVFKEIQDKYLQEKRVLLRTMLLKENLGMDSLDIVELTMFLEEQFNIEIDDQVSKNWETIGDVIDTVDLLSLAQ